MQAPSSSRRNTTTLVQKLMDGRLRLETRNDSPVIYARCFVQGKVWRYCTKNTDRTEATRLARDWYVGLEPDCTRSSTCLVRWA
jgi:hypothetical protein